MSLRELEGERLDGELAAGNDTDFQEAHMSCRHFFRVLSVISGLSIAALSQSVTLNLPRDSQHSVLTQRIGITDITINYHRPLVKGRKIWGGVVPYGDVWRAGANENTTIQFTDPVELGDHASLTQPWIMR